MEPPSQETYSPPADDGSLFHQVVGRALTDLEFRKQLMEPGSRNRALAEMGVPEDRLSEVEREIENSIDALNALSRAFGPTAIAAS
jgi:hypothetical protein